jgi:hypothetical protein
MHEAEDRNEVLLGCLREPIDDVEAYVRTIKNKSLRKAFRALALQAHEGDAIHEYHWEAMYGQRFCYDYGWCVVSGGRITFVESIHSS